MRRDPQAWLAPGHGRRARDSGRPTVLVVDDDDGIAVLLAELLREAGYRALRAHNGREGLSVARSQHPDLVLTDRMMPEVDGVALIRALRAVPNTRGIPVILMSSAYLDTQTVPGVPFLAKPFDIEDVLALVERCVGH